VDTVLVFGEPPETSGEAAPLAADAGAPGPAAGAAGALAGLPCRARSRERFFAPECPPGVPIVGHSRALRETLQLVRLVAESDTSPILIVGGTGTGKELIAAAIHALRGGNADNFIAVNCAALTASLLESELFGHVKGAFTGADREKTGLFEVAGRGTLFLDEISEMPSGLQAKLLRVLQEKKFRKVGGTRDIPCEATIQTSSNRDLAKESRDGTFRPDLYYRLAVLPITLPPLRDRPEDIPLLAEYFIETLGAAARVGPRTLSPDAIDTLLRHDWPGNVRELRNVIERALILERGPQITPAGLRMDVPATGATALTAPPTPLPTDGDLSLETAERLFITRALQETGWQRTRAAALLGITRATLHAKLKRYKIAFPGLANGGASRADDADGDGEASADLPPDALARPSRLDATCV
jgi:two-component system response regulator HydG